MSAIVLELQRDALDRSAAVPDLLRKALVVARKLKIPDFESWINSELNGYRGETSSVPEYRILHGEVKCFNPYHGWQPMTFENPEIAQILTQRPCAQSAAALETLVAGSKRSSVATMPFPPDVERSLMESMQPVSLKPVFHFSISQVVAILDTVRSTVLSWALRLEQDGIIGEGLVFSTKEQQQASASGYNVNNFYGDVSQSQFAAEAQHPVQVVLPPSLNIDDVRAIIGKIRGAMIEVSLGSEQEAELRAELATLDSQAASPKPKSGIIRQSLASVRSILEGAGGNVVGALLVELAKTIVGS